VLTVMPSVSDYRAIFEAERVVSYPVMDGFERRHGYAIDRARMEAAAEVLACPYKAHAPNWQHGRLVYAATRSYLATYAGGRVSILDVGTAKGFSALCLLWAMTDAGIDGKVTSVDVLDPHARVKRNTVAEVDGYKTLAETQVAWPEARGIEFLQSTGLKWLKGRSDRVHVAFIDGKHSADVVKLEGQRLAELQQPGDLAMFDDLQIEGVHQAVKSLGGLYQLERVEIGPNRAYAVGYRRG
jgi:predicted O-methyltransferase YrrM